MIRIEELTTEEALQMELQRRSLRTLKREDLEAVADQLLWAQWHRDKVIKGLVDQCLELEMQVASLQGGGFGAPTEEH